MSNGCQTVVHGECGKCEGCLSNELTQLRAALDKANADLARVTGERDRCGGRAAKLEEAIRGIIRVADRKTVEFDFARSLLPEN